MVWAAEEAGGLWWDLAADVEALVAVLGGVVGGVEGMRTSLQSGRAVESRVCEPSFS